MSLSCSSTVSEPTEPAARDAELAMWQGLSAQYLPLKDPWGTATPAEQLQLLPEMVYVGVALVTGTRRPALAAHNCRPRCPYVCLLA